MTKATKEKILRAFTQIDAAVEKHSMETRLAALDQAVDALRLSGQLNFSDMDALYAQFQMELKKVSAEKQVH